VKNWTTFQRMKVSAAEVEDYLVRIAKNVVVETIRQYSGLLESDVSGLEKHREFLLYPKNLDNFKAKAYCFFISALKELSLIRFSEQKPRAGFRPTCILLTDEKGRMNQFSRRLILCFSHSRSRRILSLKSTTLRSVITTRKNSRLLTEHFRKPLISVMDWYGKHSKQILALEPRRFKRV